MRQYRANLASHGLCITSYETDTGKAPERPMKFRRRHAEKRSPWNNLSRGGGRSRREPVSASGIPWLQGAKQGTSFKSRAALNSFTEDRAPFQAVRAPTPYATEQGLLAKDQGGISTRARPRAATASGCTTW